MYDTALLHETPQDCADLCDDMLSMFATGAAAGRRERRALAPPARPRSTLHTRSDDIATISSACDALALRLVAYGSGASLQSWLHAVLDSVCIDAARLQAIGGFGLSRASQCAQPQPAPRPGHSTSAEPVEWSVRSENRERLWQARHQGNFAAIALRPAPGKPRQGHFYALILIDPANPKELRRAGLLAQRLGDEAMAFSSTGTQKVSADRLGLPF